MKSESIINKLDNIIPNPKCSLNYDKDYELLIAVMLSAQSTDKRVNEVTPYLFKYNLKELALLETSKIEDIIRPVGTFKRKALYIKNIAKRILEESGGIVPNNREFIESLDGVGHKTCNVVLSEIYNEPCIAVDTHVLRVSKRLGLVNKNADVVNVEKKLMKLFPKDKWSRVHLQLVLFGRHFCKSRTPLCDMCPFKNVECKKPLN